MHILRLRLTAMTSPTLTKTTGMLEDVRDEDLSEKTTLRLSISRRFLRMNLYCVFLMCAVSFSRQKNGVSEVLKTMQIADAS
jgi:hypothetical protein